MHILVIVTDSVASPLACSPRLTTNNFPPPTIHIRNQLYVRTVYATFLVLLINPGASRCTKHRKTLTNTARCLTHPWVTVPNNCPTSTSSHDRTHDKLPHKIIPLKHTSSLVIYTILIIASQPNTVPRPRTVPLPHTAFICLLLILTTHSNWFNYTHFHDPHQFSRYYPTTVIHTYSLLTRIPTLPHHSLPHHLRTHLLRPRHYGWLPLYRPNVDHSFHGHPKTGGAQPIPSHCGQHG